MKKLSFRKKLLPPNKLYKSDFNFPYTLVVLLDQLLVSLKFKWFQRPLVDTTWWTNMVYIAPDGQVSKTVWFEFSRDKKTKECKLQFEFFRCFRPSHGGFTLSRIFSGGLSLSSSYSSAGLIVDSQVNVFYHADQLTLSQLDWPVKHGKGRGVDIAQLQEHRGSRSSTRGWTKEVHITLW